MMEKSKQKKTKKWPQYVFYTILRPFVFLYVTLFQHVRFKRNKKKVPKGPVLFISNHLSNWDGIYANVMFMTRVIHFIVHDEMFKNKFLAFVSGTLLGEVKRGVSDSDISDILMMKKLVKEGQSIGVYPEGDIDMFGRTLPVDISIAKFVKMMKVPVVVLRINGAGVRASRWSKYAHHNKIVYSIQEVLTKEQVQEMDLETLHKIITNGIKVDDFKYHVENKNKQRIGFARAEWLELGLYMCPKCHKLEVLSSKGDTVYCTNCDFKAKYHRDCSLRNENNFSSSLTKLDDWQYDELKRLIDNHKSDELILEAKDLELQHTKEVDYFKNNYQKTYLKIYKNHIEFLFNGEVINVDIKNIKSVMLQYKDVLDVRFLKEKIRFSTKKRKWSAYLYWKALMYLKSIQENV